MVFTPHRSPFNHTGRTGLTGPSGLAGRFGAVHWPFVALVCLIAGIGVGILYSVAGGSLDPWARTHAMRFALAFSVLMVALLVDIKTWMRAAYPLYGVTLLALVAVEVAGLAGGGARRWLAISEFQLQPSEFMKLALVLALARYYQKLDSGSVSRLVRLVIPALMIAAPAALVLRQPDLGTAMLLLAGGGAVLFAAGVHWVYFASAALCVGAAMPFAWQALHSYQQARILTFLDPERDPLGAGYHIIQSKIALGSGSIFGKGFVKGTQSQLNFVPEKHTDFIFAMVGEEFGFVGTMTLLGLYSALIILGLSIAVRIQNRFGRLAALGITTMLFFYVFINIAMVTGLVPVVGVPLPLVSYGGTVMVTLMLGFGVLMSAHIDQKCEIPRPLVVRR